MSWFEILQMILLVSFLILGTVISYRQVKLEKELRNIKDNRVRFYQSLADPKLIEAEMEKSARAREMRDAQRTTLPREGAGPPAKVYRPKLRGAKPGNWRVQRP